MKDLDGDTFAIPRTTPHLAVTTFTDDVLQLYLSRYRSLDQQRQTYHRHATGFSDKYFWQNIQ